MVSPLKNIESIQNPVLENGWKGNKFLFPQTRYQGSKLKLIPWLKEIFEKYSYSTVLDGFSGTGVVSYLFKLSGKTITSNDILKSNQTISHALIENQSITLSPQKVKNLLKKQQGFHYESLIQDHFKNIYFTDNENKWLDLVIQNIHNSMDLTKFEKSIAFFGLFQACLIKRPYNLFHRANLYLRMASVPRSFGNKVTWDRPFPKYFSMFIEQANKSLFDRGSDHQALNSDIFDIQPGFDLVYFDPPYMNQQGIAPNYQDFYHFLEGILCYGSQWLKSIDKSSKNRKLKTSINLWNDLKENYNAFERLIKRFSDSVIVLSYRSPGIPSISSINDTLYTYKRKVDKYIKSYNYVLSTKRKVEEVVLVGHS